MLMPLFQRMRCLSTAARLLALICLLLAPALAAPTWIGSVSLNGGAASANLTAATAAFSATSSAGAVTQLQLSWDGKAFTPWEAYKQSRAVSLPAGDGLKTLRVVFKDVAGNLSPTYTDDILLDTKSPTGTMSLNAGASATLSTTATLTLNPDADPSGIVQMQFSKDGGAWTAWEAFKTARVLTLPSSIGIHTVSARIKDGAGNSSADLSDSIELTHFLPVRVTLNGGAATTATTAGSAQLAATSNAGAVTQMQLSWDGKTYNAWEDYKTARVVSIPSGDGLKTLYVIFKDAAGNVSKPFTASITRDNQAPTGSVQIEGGAATAPTSAVTLALQTTDAAGGQIQMAFSTDSASWSDWEPFAPSKALTLLPGAGSRSAYVRFKDALGNTSAVYSDAIDVIDWTGSVSLDAGSAYSNNIAPNATRAALQAATGCGTSVVQQQLSWDGATWTSWAPYMATTPVTLAAGDGPKTLSVRFQDSLGHLSPVYSDAILLDTQAPTGNVTINAGAPMSPFSVVTLTLQARDEASGVGQMAFSKDGGAWTTWEAFAPTRVVTLPAGLGDHTVTVRFKDGAGNQGTASGSIRVAALSASDLFAQEKVHPGTAGIKASFPRIPGTTCRWTLTSGTILSGATSEVVVYRSGEQTGTYQLSVEIKGPAGLTTSVSRSLNIVNREFLADPTRENSRLGGPVIPLENGTLLVIGGMDAELYDLRSETWIGAGSMHESRHGASVTRLADGRVLVAGGFYSDPSWRLENGQDPVRSTAELYDPATRTWQATSSLPDSFFDLWLGWDWGYVDLDERFAEVAPLPDGGALLVQGNLASRYDPGTRTWSEAAGKNSNFIRAVLPLADGRVLAIGQTGAPEFYDPARNIWEADTLVLSGVTDAVVLASGQVLVCMASASRLYDPLARTLGPAAAIPDWNAQASATTLLDGRILLVGKSSTSASPASAALYDPSLNTWTRAGDLSALGSIAPVPGGSAIAMTTRSLERFDPVGMTWSARRSLAWGQLGMQFPNGKVLVATDTEAALYDPVTGAWSPAGSPACAHTSFTQLPGGKVLCTGATTEFYDPALNTWSLATSLATKDLRAMKLLDGRILVGWKLLYNPATDTWAETAPRVLPDRSDMKTALLADGQVLLFSYARNAVEAGDDGRIQRYDPVTDTWTLLAASVLYDWPKQFTWGNIVVMPNGQVFCPLSCAGYYPFSWPTFWAEYKRYDPATDSWVSVGSAGDGRAILGLADGKLLAAGGFYRESVDSELSQTIAVSTASLYDPAIDQWIALPPMQSAGPHSFLQLQDGRVLFLGEGMPEFWKP